MKTKSLFVATLAAFTLFSCSKEKISDSSENNNSTSLAMSITVNNMSRAMEDPADITALDITAITIDVYNAQKVKIGNSVEINDATLISNITNNSNGIDDASRIVITDISNEAAFVKIVASKGTTATVPDATTKINAFQIGFKDLPFSKKDLSVDDFIEINKSNTTPSTTTKKKVWTIEAALSPYLARFEVSGEVKAKEMPFLDQAANTGNAAWADIKVTGIYINNIKDLVTDNSLILNQSNHDSWGAGDWATGHPYKTDGLWSNMFNVVAGSEANATTNASLFANPNNTKVAAYQVFPQGEKNNSTTYEADAVPHIIVRLLVTPNKLIVDKEPYYAFITLSKFKINEGGNTDNYLNKVERGKIYRVNLADLAAVAEGDLDPDPESSEADLYAKITIENWTSVILKPEL